MELLEEEVITNGEKIKYFESKISRDLEEKYRPKFEKYACYISKYDGYEWRGLIGTDTRELFLRGIILFEKIKVPDKYLI